MSYLDDHEHLKIKLKVIQEATDYFRNEPIGTGGFGDVYKGELFLQEGPTVVAIKRLDRKHGQGDVEFWKEITMLSGLQHENLATLLHFCSEDKERILVYKYASLGSLDHYLGDTSLTWTQRLKICIGAASGIAYLHDPRMTQHRVLHRDIKSSNILLDDKWTAIVSDFGLSKIGPANQPRSYLVSNIVGTPGYCDPAYFETGILSKECDVYSFGVVLFEVLCGRLCCVYDNNQLKSILVNRWRKCYVENRLGDIIFPDLKEQISKESLLTFSAIAYQCLDRDHKKRPKMVEILKELEIALHQQNTSQYQAIVAKTPMSSKFMEEFHHLKIHLEEVKSATNNFSNRLVIGAGGFGNVYKGALNLEVGNGIVAVKRLDRRYGQGEAEFWKVVMMLSRYRHENLLSLLKVCNEHGESILVYEYASRGSLDHHLNRTRLTWIQRLRLCLGVARALNYLHGPSETQVGVVHQDIKSSSILLNDKWNVKLSNFGMSKVVTGNELQIHPISDDIVGTPGYCDPAYFETGILSKESDVYSFGVVLFEVLCGRTCYEFINGQIKILVPTWRKSYDEQRLHDIIFSGLIIMGQMYSGSLDTFSSIAYQCVRKDPQERPTMAKVMKELEIALQQEEHFEEMMSIENLAVSRSISSTSKNQPLMQFPEGVLVGDGNTWLSKHKNGKVCEIISAILCISGDSLIPDSTENSRFTNVLRGVMHNGFKVKARTQFLSPKVTYAISLVFNHNAADPGTHIPFKFKVDTESHYSNPCITHAREDGWQMIELYQFTSCKRENDFGFEFLPLFIITSSSIEYVLEGIEFRPVEYVS